MLCSGCRGSHPFDPRNAIRLRWLAAAVLVAPIIDVLQAAIVDRTLDDAELPVRLVAHDPSWTAVLLIGLGLLALAEVFREGSNLRELEKATI